MKCASECLVSDLGWVWDKSSELGEIVMEGRFSCIGTEVGRVLGRIDGVVIDGWRMLLIIAT